MHLIAFVDLDDTLFQTLPKCPADIPPEALTPLGFARDGSPLSYATPRQISFLKWLSEAAILIPVTGRSRNALERVQMNWSRAVCAHGGVILDAPGQVDRAWAENMARGAEAHGGLMSEIAAWLRASAGDVPIAVTIVEEAGTPLYVLAKHSDGDAAALSAVMDAMEPFDAPGWTLHRNGNNAAFLPPFLSKRAAVERLIAELRATYPDAAFLGVGDSITDAPFMALCDFAALPTASQLADAAFLRFA
jgi:hypothetical protein